MPSERRAAPRFVVSSGLALGVVLVLGLGLAPAGAQEPPPGSAPPEPARPVVADRDATDPEIAEALRRMDELDAWTAAYTSWKIWAAEWANTREPGWFTGSRDRREKPDPPAWLASTCDELADPLGVLADACQLLAEWRLDLATALHAPAPPSATPEAVVKTAWWEYVHVDLLWPVTPGNAAAYGLAGMHASVALAGRLHVFVIPGVMFLSLPSPGGGREWTAATHWGIGYRLVQFTMPGTRRSATLHINVARAWLLGNRPSTVGSSLNLAGFSLTFNRQR
jgi:hypothetical protein